MSNQGLRQASIRTSTGTAGTYEEDWIALFDDDGIAAGTFNERLYAWLTAETGLTGRTLDEMMVAWAVTQGVATWSQLGALTLTPAAPPAAPVIDLLAISDRGASTTDNITNDPLPQFSIDLPDDTEAGDVVRLKVDGSTVATHELTAGDLSGGEFFMGAAPLADGTYDFTTTLEDAGGESVASNTETVTIDTSLGAATLALAAGGLITADTTPTMRVSNAAAVENDIAEVRSSTGTVLGTKTWDATDATNGYADATLSALSVAEHTLTAYVYGTAGGSGAGTFSAVTVEILEIAAALAISGTPVLTATEDTAYAGFTASATGGVTPYVFSLVGTWPAGISIDSGTGVVSGTPTESGSFASLSVRVTDDEGSTDDLATFTLEVEAASVFDPTAVANIALLLDASILASLSQTINGATPVTANAQAVGYWGDQSGAGFHLTAAADDATRAQYGTTDNPHVEFLGSVDVLFNTSSLGLYANGSASVVLVVRSLSAVSGSHLFAETSNADNDPVYSLGDTATTTANATEFIRNDAATFLSNVQLAATNAYDGNDRVLIITDSGSELKAYVDGSLVDTKSYTRSGTLTLNRTCLGALIRIAAGQHWKGRVYAVAAVKRVIDSGEIADFTTWGGAKQGRSI